ncbi:MAG: enoyl-CoA hydratase/isomerase family protein [Burkholderiales bacterium]|nr:enoyl-CoA hydratase/isomerase family protein [Burkholderiales bacterium]
MTDLDIARDRDVLFVRIERPEKRNALSRALIARIGTAFAAHAADASLKAAVITGAGDRAFAAGGDLHELAAVRGEDEARALYREARAALEQVRVFPLPVVAALNGVALGGGAELALACDFRVAAAHAAIGFVQARLNICTGFGGGADLMRLLGRSGGLLAALRAEIMDARAARAAGLVDEVAAPEETLEACLERFLAPLRARAPQVIRAYKAIALSPEAEMEGFVRTWTHPDHWVAAASALAKA